MAYGQGQGQGAEIKSGVKLRARPGSDLRYGLLVTLGWVGLGWVLGWVGSGRGVPAL